MTILHLASEYPPQPVFGLGRFVRDLAEEQAKQGHAVTVITNSFGGEEPSVLRNGVRVLRTFYPPPPQPPTSAGCLIIFNILLLRRICELGFEQIDTIDVVCSHDWLTAPAAQAVRDAFGIRHICTFHDVIWGKRLEQLSTAYDQFAARAEAWVVNKACLLIANSTATKNELVRRYRADPQNITVVPCALAPHTFSVTHDTGRLKAFRAAFLDENELLILYVGRLDPEKGVSVLLDALTRTSLPAFKLLIAGQGALQESLNQRVTAGKLEDKVVFLGYVENPVLANLYACADILACPSLYEPFGMVALEGMLQGVPVIASNVGGLADLVQNDRCGLLVPPNDPNALASALDSLARNPEKRKAMGHEARRFVLANHTWPKACAATMAVYEKHSHKSTPIRPEGIPRILAAAMDGPGYGAGRFAKAVVSIQCFQQPGTRTITTGGDDLFSIAVEDRVERRLLQAFQMAAKLLPLASTGETGLVCFDWNARLAALVLGEQRRSREMVLILNPMNRRSSDYPYDALMDKWATSLSDEIVILNSDEIRQLSGQGKAVKVLPNVKASLPQTEIFDRVHLRAVLAAPEQKLAVIALRLEPPFDVDFFLAVVQECVASKISIQWIICGCGYLRNQFESEVHQKKLPVSFAGYLYDHTLSAIITIADVAYVPFRTCHSTRFIEEALTLKVPVVAARGTRQLMGLTDTLLAEWEGSNASDVVRSLALVLGNTPSSRSLIPSRLPNSSQFQLVSESNAKSPDFQSQRLKNPAELVLYNDWGLGDEVLLSAVARELKHAHPQLKVWIRSRYGFAFPAYCEPGTPPPTAVNVETIYQNAALYGPQHHSPFPGHLVQQMLDKVSITTGITVRARNIRPELRPKNADITRTKNRVVFHCRPNGRLLSKDWGLERWEALCDMLGKKGVQLVQVGSKDEPKFPGVEDLRGLEPNAISDVIRSADLVICLVGFLMHLAAATNTRAIVIYGGREHPLIDGYPDHIHLGCEPLDCSGRWGCHLGADDLCSHSMRCMNNITPELVFKWAETALDSN